MNLRIVRATRYVCPLREGGSLPAIVEGDDDGTYVVKFRGAGQGHKALIAEILGGEIARALGLRVPELVWMEVSPDIARTEPDAEIQALLRASAGLNLALDYLPGSITFDPLIPKSVQNESELATQIIWLDAFLTNVDRTPRNPNLLVWHSKLWLIDHGAALYFHHAWNDYLARAQSPFAPIKEHVLLPFSGDLNDVSEELAAKITPQVLADAVQLVPDAWLNDVEQFANANEHRAAYCKYLQMRLEARSVWISEANRARQLV